MSQTTIIPGRWEIKVKTLKQVGKATERAFGTDYPCVCPCDCPRDAQQNAVLPYAPTVLNFTELD